MAKTGLEDWLETLGSAVVAATLPLAVGVAIRMLGEIGSALAASERTRYFERAATVIAPAVVVVLGPLSVFLWARWAARVTRGSPVVRAGIVGIGPAVLIGLLFTRDAFRSAMAALPFWFVVFFVLGWALLHLAAGVAAGLLTQNRARRDGRGPGD